MAIPMRLPAGSIRVSLIKQRMNKFIQKNEHTPHFSISINIFSIKRAIFLKRSSIEIYHIAEKKYLCPRRAMTSSPCSLTGNDIIPQTHNS
jgi:hypothetical protein